MTNPFNQFQLTYELSPIILVNGIATGVPGSMLPVISLTQAQDFSGGILESSIDALKYEDFVAHFAPMPGSTMIENQVGMYPFANQQVAANAIVVQPLRLSMMMVAPAPSGLGGYPLKLAAFSSLQQQLSKHNILGGTYTVATPIGYYTDMLLQTLRDVTGDEGRQVQARWQWDFIKPLLTQADAASAEASLENRYSMGLPFSGDPIKRSGTAITVGNPASGGTPPTVPAGQQTIGTPVSFGMTLTGTTDKNAGGAQ